VRRVAAWPAGVWRAAAAFWFLLLCVVGTAHQTLILDGTRYFWINDDMMVSMRYARNLAEGHGLVFNPGEHVEGYSNLLWTLVMAGVHRLPFAPSQFSLGIVLVNAGLGLMVLFLTDRLRHHLDPAGGWSRPAALLGMAFSMDLAFWAVKGFETTLLTALFLWALTRVLADAEHGPLRLLTLVPLSLLPLVRTDALHVWAAVAVVALGLLRPRSRTLPLLALSLLPFALHLLWRHGYYGDWLPNTYYLKISGQPDRLELGARYLLRFSRDYGVALALALLGVWAAREARRRFLLATVAMGAAYAIAVGGDMLPYSRFLAHLVPVIVVLAAVAARDLAPRAPLSEAALALCLVTSILLGFQTYLPSLLEPSRGHEADTLVTAVLVGRHTRPEARVAVFAAGAVPYFSRRVTVDMLGKTDPSLARTPARVPFAIGHAKFDPVSSLAQRPDLVVTLVPEEALSAPGGTFHALNALVRDPVFLRDYRPYPVPLAFLQSRSAVYVRADSVERQHLSAWREP
jgi:arabinofuranosyltransferase